MYSIIMIIMYNQILVVNWYTMHQILRKNQHSSGDWCQVQWLWFPSARWSQRSKDPCPSSQTYEWCKWNQYRNHRRMGCWEGQASSHLKDSHPCFMWHWTKHISWGDWNYQKVTKDLYIMPVNYWYCTSYLHSRLSCCRNCYLSTLCKIYITYMVGHPLHFFNCVVTL